MCRMIAAVGRFEMKPLVDALRTMSANSNSAHDHEFRSEGDAFQHDCGWGTVYREKTGLTRYRTIASCVDDPDLDRLSSVATTLAVLHARRTPDRSSIAERNSHPFVETRFDTVWAFCHNGTVRDVTQFDSDGSPREPNTVDSEVLFHHILGRLDPGAPADSLSQVLNDVHDFTCLNCFLVSPGAVHAYARVSPDTTRPLYYTLWIGRGDGYALATSEVLPLPGVEWEAVRDGRAVTLSV